MKRYSLLSLLLGIVLLGCGKKSEQELLPPIHEVFDLYYEERLQLYPLEATRVGDNRYNHLFFNDISEEGRRQVTDFYTRYKTLLDKYTPEMLIQEEKISREILLWECTTSLENLAHPLYLMPVNQIFSKHLTIPQWASGTNIQPFKTVEDYDNWLARVDQFIAWGDTAISNMRKGMTAGYVLPAALTKKLISQFEQFSSGSTTEHLFYTPVKNLPEDFSETDKNRLTAAYTEMVEQKVIPLYNRFHAFAKDEYLPVGRKSSGIGSLPNGAAIYAAAISRFTSTQMTADEIHQIGLDEVARITQEMEQIKEKTGFKGTLKAFFSYLRSNKQFTPYSEPEEIIANFKTIHTRMQPSLQKLFDLTPKASFEVRRTEAFREATASAEYNPASTDGSRPGIFYVPVPNVQDYNNISDESLFLHEAIPGHHYQISLQQENEKIPTFRKNSWYSAYGEGWALYAESLGKELGLFTDPYQHFGMLSLEMHRAIRLVVDTGIHAKGWSREKAIQYSMDHEAGTEESITAEIERYMAEPGQALSYKIGQLKIQELRRKAERSLGNKFNIREFHNQVLETGCVPLKLLEEKLNRWIIAQK
jgi:uncharacterized protein (DUF885 family)